MSKIRTIAAIAACKLSRNILRMMHRGGTAAPGNVALKICPDLLGEMAKGVKCIVVTGTNGKTTSARMLEQCLIDTGKSYFANKSGSNLLRGITAEFAMNCGPTGRCKKEWALIECDEAAFKTVSQYIDADYILVTNVFRDQLDRYGEITHTLNNIKVGILNSPNAKVCLNADCSLSSSMADEIPNEITYYGVNIPIYAETVEEVSDAPYCIRCKTEYEYDYHTYGHLGGFRCPNCGYHRPHPQIAVTEILASDTESSQIRLDIDGQSRDININLPGGYNIYNAAGVAAASWQMGFTPEDTVDALENFECGFGRMEKFDIEGVSLQMILIKNPAGCNQVLNFLANLTTPSAFTVCLNDNYADGTDISWIWDVHFEGLLEHKEMLTEIFVSGVRADDMALRFKYAGFDTEKIHVIKDYEMLLDAMLSQDAPVYIMPTYTAMTDLREIISRKYGFKDFWA